MTTSSSPPNRQPKEQANKTPTWAEAIGVWVKVAALSFGGPAGQIAVMHQLLVEQRGWISESRFLHALNYCMLLPGPEAQQLATYLGWLLHGIRGGLMAGLLFILPGFISVLALSMLYAFYRDTTIVEALFYGLRPAVVAIVLLALIRIGGKVLNSGFHLALAGTAFVAIFFLSIPFPWIVLGAALTGLVFGRHKRDDTTTDEASDNIIPETRPTIASSLRQILLWLSIWLLPVLVLLWVMGSEHVLTEEGLFFSKAAVLTFGGAYAVLAYIAQQAVETYGWLAPGEMLDGLGMAETTPGPLIQVVQFVGFMGAFRLMGGVDPLVAGILASLVVTWVTFVPSFMWIFVGAPYNERLRNNQSLRRALSAVTAAIVGVILNLALWFSLHSLFASQQQHQVSGFNVELPVWASIDLTAVALALGALLLLTVFRRGMLLTTLICASCGLLLALL